MCNAREERALAARPSPDGYRPDGYRPDGYRPDGYRPDGYRPDGYRPDGHCGGSPLRGMTTAGDGGLPG